MYIQVRSTVALAVLRTGGVPPCCGPSESVMARLIAAHPPPPARTISQVVPFVTGICVSHKLHKRIRAAVALLMVALELPLLLDTAYQAPTPLAEGGAIGLFELVFRLILAGHNFYMLFKTLIRWRILGHRHWPVTALCILLRVQRNNDLCMAQPDTPGDHRLFQELYNALLGVSSLGLLGAEEVSTHHACAVSSNFIALTVGLVIPLLFEGAYGASQSVKGACV